LIDLITVKRPRAPPRPPYLLHSPKGKAVIRDGVIILPQPDVSLTWHGGVIDLTEESRRDAALRVQLVFLTRVILLHSRTRGNSVVCMTPTRATNLAPFDLLSTVIVKIPRGAILVTTRR